MELRFVTGNDGKVRELAEVLDLPVVKDPRGYPEIQADTLQEVAAAGVGHLDDVPRPFVLEDAGLFVHALQGFPGVYSRYALDTIGNQGLLKLLEGVELEQRTAHFEACLTYVDGAVHHFVGRVDGTIATAPAGQGGFGFDPVFIPKEGDGRTFAQMSDAEKTSISHRGRAAQALAEHLKKQANP